MLPFNESMSFILILFAFFVLFSSTVVLGLAFTKNNKSSFAFNNAPVIGLSAFLLIAAMLQYLQTSLLFCFVPVLAAGVYLYKSQLPSLKTLFMRFYLPFFLSLSLFAFPYIYSHRFALNITGYIINNDTVVHALLSRDCTDNILLATKLYVGSDSCITSYPQAGHSLINIASKLTNIQNSMLVIPLSIFAASFSVFPLRFFLSKVNRIKSELVLAIASSFSTATYFSTAIAYHGFYTQVLFVPLFLSLSLMVTAEKDRLFNQKLNILILSLLIAAVIRVYGFVGVIPLALTMAMTLVFYSKKVPTLTRGLILTTLTTLLLLGESGVQTVRSWFDILFSMFQPVESTILSETQSLGNLIGHLDNRIGTGVWFERDYRFANATGLRNVISDLFSSLLSLVAIFSGFYYLVKEKKVVFLSALPFLIAFLLVMSVTGSPYSAAKMQSLLFPFIPAFIISGLLLIKKHVIRYTLLACYLLLLTASNIILLKWISVLPGSVLASLNKLSLEISDEEEVLFVTDNDWALYYVDSPSVDISSIHYLKDTDIRNIEEYSVVINDGKETFPFSCSQRQTVGDYFICKRE